MTIPKRQEALEKFIARYFPEPAHDPESNGGHAPNGHALRLSDDEVVELCRKAKNAAKFADLFDNGDTAAYGHDDSRADQALVSLLVFYTDDPEQLDRLFRRSALYRSEKWGRRADYRQRTIKHALDNRTESYRGSSSSSSRPLRVNDDDDSAAGPLPGLKLTSFAAVPRPSDERPAVVKGMIPKRFPAIIFGDGGTAKSLLASSLLLDISRGAESWLGHKILQSGTALYVDFELDLQEQARRVYQLAEGVNLDKPPEDFYYLSGADHPAGAVLARTLQLAKKKKAAIVLLDSLGFALEGDAEASRDVLRFIRKHIKPFESAGITMLIVDHQAKLAGGEGYHQKSPFGSVYKSNACRSVIQVGVEDQREGELTVRFRHTKANFGSKFDPFDVTLLFHKTKIEIHHRALDSEEIATEGSLNVAQKIRRLLKERPMFPEELAEKIGCSEGTVKNNLTTLRKNGEVENTGETGETGAHQVRLRTKSPSSSSLRDDDDGDDSVWKRTL